jgi:prepilin-type N-terminal cleavage/methylation domain-containing protein
MLSFAEFRAFPIKANIFYAKNYARQYGYTLIELAVALIIISVLSIYAAKKLIQDTDDASAAATGAYVVTAAAGLERYVIINYAELINRTPVVKGVSNPLAPTMAELKTILRLPSNFPAFAPNQQQVQFDIDRSEGCLNASPSATPISSCVLLPSACLTAPLKVRGIYRDDLVTQAVMTMQGHGGRSRVEAPATIRGASFSVRNPVNKTPVGILCAANTVDAALYDQFLKFADARDPMFRGDVSIAGDLKVGKGSPDNGVTACALSEILSSERATSEPFPYSVGQILSRASNCIRRAWMDGASGIVGVADQAGTTRAILDGSTGNILSYDSVGKEIGGLRRAADSVTGTVETQLFADTISNNKGSFSATSAGDVSVKTLVLSSAPYDSFGAKCNRTGAMAWINKLGKVVLGRCKETGTWDSAEGASVADLGAACTPEGSGATSVTGVQLICSGAKYVNLTDRMGSLVPDNSYAAKDGDTVPFPTCFSDAAVPLIFFMVGNESQNIQFVNRYAEISGNGWTIFIRDGDKNPMIGKVIAMTYCSY